MNNETGFASYPPTQSSLDVPISASIWRDVFRTRERMHCVGIYKVVCSRCYKFVIQYHEQVFHSLVAVRVIADMVNAHSLVIC